MESEHTLVTQLFDIKRPNRGTSEYFRWSDGFNMLNGTVVSFMENEFVEHFVDARERFHGRTCWIAMSWTETYPFYDLQPVNKKCIRE